MLGLAIIVKDELKQVEEILSKYSEYFDEVGIAVDFHINKFRKLKKKYPNLQVFEYEWCDDFAHKRNFLAEKMKSTHYLRMDTDDTITNPENIRGEYEKMLEHDIDVLYSLYDYAQDDSGNTNAEHWRETIIKKSESHYWKKRIHENIFVEDQKTFKGVKTDKFKMVHHMSMDHAIKSSERNLRILLKEFQEDPNNADPRTIGYIARTLMGQGKHGVAVPFFEKFLTTSGWEEDKYYAWCQLAECHLRCKNINGCKQAANEAMLMNPNFPDAYFILGQMALDQNNYEDAVSWFEIVLTKKVPDTMSVINPTLYGYVTEISMAMAYLGKGDFEKAYNLYRIAKAKAPQDEFVAKHEKLIVDAYENNEFFKRFIWVAKYMEEKDPQLLPVLANSIPRNLFVDERAWHLKNRFNKPKVWGEKELAIYCGQAWEEWSPDSVKDGIGGSEEAVIYISQEFTKLGYKVTVYNSIVEQKDFDGVTYKPYYEFNPKDKFNILIGWRGNVFKGGIEATHRWIWMHDVPQPDQFQKDELATFDKVIVLSEYHKSLLPSHIPEDKIFVSSNGINLADFESDEVKNPKRLIYTSSYDRGLENLLDIWPDVIKEVPDAELHIFYGWNTYDAMVKKGFRSSEFKDMMVKKMDQPGVIEHGRVGHKELVQEFFKSGIYAYPSHFEEISCISAMKAQACGCIPVTTDYAALTETVKIKDFVVSGSAKNCLDTYKDTLVKALKEYPNEVVNKLNKIKESFGWDKVAEQWHNQWSEGTDKEFIKSRIGWMRDKCPKDATIVDIGGNEGHTFEGYDRSLVTTVDIDKYDVENFVQCDVTKGLPFEDKQFDIAVMGEICEHFVDPVAPIQEAIRVANKVVITVPYEYEWADHLEPFHQITDKEEKHGKTREQLAREHNPNCVEFHTEDNLEHLWHHQFYTPQSLEEVLKDAGATNYTIKKLYQNEWVFLSAIVES